MAALRDADAVLDRHVVRHVAAGARMKFFLTGMESSRSMANFMLSCWLPSSMMEVSGMLPPMTTLYLSEIALAASRSTFSSTEMESGPVWHMTSMLRVASPQTKKEENAPFSRMKRNSSVYGGGHVLLKVRSGDLGDQRIDDRDDVHARLDVVLGHLHAHAVAEAEQGLDLFLEVEHIGEQVVAAQVGGQGERAADQAVQRGGVADRFLHALHHVQYIRDTAGFLSRDGAVAGRFRWLFVAAVSGWLETDGGQSSAQVRPQPRHSASICRSKMTGMAGPACTGG